MKFLHHIQQDAKLFLYLNILIMIFRWAFIAVYSGQLNTVAGGELWTTFWLGLRISLKTSAALTGVALVASTIPGSFLKRWPAERIRLIWGSLATALLTFLFIVRIPYYQVFHQTYNIMLFNGMKDDKGAIWETIVGQYQLWPRLAACVVLAAIFIWCWRRLSRTKTWQPKRHVRIILCAVVVFLPVFAIFCRFGGAFNSDNGVPWEDAARTRSNLLNEAVLDDGQALYRAYKTNQRAYRTAQRNISVTELKAAIVTLGGNPEAKTVDEAFLRKAPGSPLSAVPQHVVLVVGENYAVWPLLPQYEELGLCRRGEQFGRDGAKTYQFLSAGNGTMTSLNGLFTGLPDVGLSPNYIHTPGGSFGTGIGMVMKKLGYKTVFWYGGLSSWQEIKAFTLREGFDEFHCADEMPQQNEGSWGVPDGALFEAIQEYMKKDTGKTFHMIMTTTNHPPFAYDVDGAGFPRSEVTAKLPKSIPTDKETIDQLGHIWYADDVMGKFITATQQEDPGALFVITGDHGERFNFATDVSLTELSGVPCIIYGAGVTADLLPATAVGSHLQIMPTLASLILPQGAEYEALLPPLMQSQKAFNHRLVIEDGVMREAKNMQDKNYESIIQAARTVATWRIMKGNEIS